jgi:hypothetical protein
LHYFFRCGSFLSPPLPRPVLGCLACLCYPVDPSIEYILSLFPHSIFPTEPERLKRLRSRQLPCEIAGFVGAPAIPYMHCPRCTLRGGGHPLWQDRTNSALTLGCPVASATPPPTILLTVAWEDLPGGDNPRDVPKERERMHPSTQGYPPQGNGHERPSWTPKPPRWNPKGTLQAPRREPPKDPPRDPRAPKAIPEFPHANQKVAQKTRRILPVTKLHDQRPCRIAQRNARERLNESESRTRGW